jgi:hypothetical protein
MHTKDLVLEWRHLEKDGATCARCADTGAAVRAVVAGLTAECGKTGWRVRFLETRLGEDEMAQSNLLLVNGQPIEDLLSGASSGMSRCASCSELTGQPTDCRTVVFGGQTYETLPAALIREAMLQAIHRC